MYVTAQGASAHSGNSAWFIATVLAMVVLTLFPASAEGTHRGYLTSADPLIELDSAVPSGGRVIPIINSGDVLGDFTFEGLPDGIGIAPNRTRNSVDVYVAHEQTTVPFFGSADFQDASISKLTLSTSRQNLGAVLDSSVALGRVHPVLLGVHGQHRRRVRQLHVLHR